MFSLLSFFSPSAHAATTTVTALTPPGPCVSIFTNGVGSYPGEGFDCIASYVAMLTSVLIGFGAAVAIIMLIVNGYQYMVGPAFPGGSSDAAKKGITTALAGLALALLTYTILDTLIYAVTQ